MTETYEEDYAPLPPTGSSQDEEYAGQLREQRVRTLLTEIDPENLLESLEFRLKGYKFNRTTHAWEKRENEKE